MAKTTRFLPLATLFLCCAMIISPHDAEAKTKSHRHKHASTHAKTLIPAQSPKYAMIIMDAQSGRILEEKEMHKPLPPASTTKIMTLFMTFEALQRGQIHMDDPLTITRHAQNQAPSKIGLNPNNPITVREAIYVAVTRSANDVAMALAETIGGSEERFCQMMTARARSLGMRESFFANPSGLPNPRQKSSAYDMAILARATMQYFPQYYHIFNTIRYNYRGQTIETHNNLMRRFKGMDGLKTGYTVASGFNLVASSVRNNRRIIVVVFGGTSAVSRDNHVADLMDHGLAMLSGQQPVMVASNKKTAPVAPVKAEVTQPDPTPVAAPQPQVQETVQPAAVVVQKKPEPVVTRPAPQVAAVTPPPSAPATADRAGWQPDGGHVRPLSVPANTAQASDDDNTTSTRTASADPSRKWGIQVGAYNSQSLGEQSVQTALKKLRHILSGEGQPVVISSSTASGTIYRARIIGLSAQHASKACHVLQQCMTFSMR